jgi:hypothetical protein
LECALQSVSPGDPLNEECAAEYQREPRKAHVGHPETPTVSRNKVGARRLPIFHVQIDGGGDSGHEGWPKKEPAPSKAHCDRIIKDVAMSPVGGDRLCARVRTASIKTCRAHMLCAQLQVTERAEKASTSLATSLKGFVGMKETRRLVAKSGRDICTLPGNRPEANLQFRVTENADLRSVLRRKRSDRAFATRATDRPQS